MKIPTIGCISFLLLYSVTISDCNQYKTALDILKQNHCICPCGNPNGGKLYYVPNERLNWFDAVASCNSLGMSIATIQDTIENQSLQRYLEQLRPKLRVPRRSNTPYWIGANTLLSGGGLRWGLSKLEAKRPDWDTSAEDSNTRSSPYCVYLKGDTMKWMANACDREQRQFICEY